MLCEPDGVDSILALKKMPLLLDDLQAIRALQPDVVVDGRMLKRDDPVLRSLASFTIGVGPGFVAGASCGCVIETMRGHDLGRLIWQGTASKDTGIPGKIGGESARRVIYSPAAGKAEWLVDFGDQVEKEQALGTVAGVPVFSTLDGIVRGLISPRVAFPEKTKIADVDPRGAEVDFHSISDKARSVGRAVLEAVMIYKANNE